MRLGRTSLALLLLVVVCTALGAEPRIEHEGLRCIAPGKFALVLSIIDPDKEVQTAKVYFRSALYPDFYYVEMRREEGGEGNRFVGILPQVAPETPRIIYYVEVVDQIFDSVRSAEFDPTVGECKDDPKAAFFPGDSPGIVVGAVSSGASAIPPGFSAAGIVGAITAAGAATGVGGGISTGVVVAAAAGAAGAGGIVVATSQGGQTTTSVSSSPPSATTAPSTTTVVAGPGPPPATTTVAPGSTTTAATTTTSSISSTSTAASTSTSSSTTTTAAAPLDSSCFTVQLLGACSVRVDATCVAPPVDRYDWVLDRQNKFRRVTITNGPPVVTQTWTAPDCDVDDVLIFRLTVFRGAASSQTEKSLFVPVSLTASRADAGPTTLQTRLDLPMGRGSESARILVDGALVRALRSEEPAEISLALARGVHEIELVLARADGLPGTWSVSFPSGGLRPGSLRPVEGNVLSTTPNGLTFRLSGTSGERARVRFELEP
jgi:hypothetical protein